MSLTYRVWAVVGDYLDVVHFQRIVLSIHYFHKTRSMYQIIFTVEYNDMNNKRFNCDCIYIIITHTFVLALIMLKNLKYVTRPRPIFVSCSE